MRFDYTVRWYEGAEIELLHQARYIREQSQNPQIAVNFYQAIKSEVNKLSFLADVYRLKQCKELVVLKRYKVKFLVGKNTVFIVQFRSTRQNS